MVKVNKKYKDRLFRMVFNRKEELISLYNAISHSEYTDPEELEIYTLEDVIYMKMKNDLAFLIDDVLNLWEHQSTWNPNMPVRGAFYIVEGAEPVWKPSDYASRSSILCILQWLEGRAGQCRAEVIQCIFHASSGTGTVYGI